MLNDLTQHSLRGQCNKPPLLEGNEEPSSTESAGLKLAPDGAEGISMSFTGLLVDGDGTATGSVFWGMSITGRATGMMTGDGELAVIAAGAKSFPSGTSVLGVTKPTWRILGPITDRRLESIAPTLPPDPQHQQQHHTHTYPLTTKPCGASKTSVRSSYNADMLLHIYNIDIQGSVSPCAFNCGCRDSQC